MSWSLIRLSDCYDLSQVFWNNYQTFWILPLKAKSQEHKPVFLVLRANFFSKLLKIVLLFQAIQLKNVLYSKDETLKTEYQERWLRIEEDMRSYIKNKCIETLGTETQRPSQAAQCVGYIACVELPRNLWPDCISMVSMLKVLF